MAKKEESSQVLEVNENASTRTIQASFRRKAKQLQSGNSGAPVSKKTFQELNEAYQALMQNRQQQKAVNTKKVTILSSDVAGYSRMMATHEKETLSFFNFCKDVFEEIVDKWHGRVFNTAGDAILAEFEYEFNAVHCAIEIQRELHVVNRGQPEDLRIQFRIGLNIGEVFLQEGDLLGDAVNIAARIQTAAKPGGVCMSAAVYNLLADKLLYPIHDLGEQTYKNIPEPIRTYAVTDDAGSVKRPLPDPKIGVAPKSVNYAEPEPKATRRTEKRTETSSGGKNAAVALALLAAAGGGGYYYFSPNQPARTQASQPNSRPAATTAPAVAPSHVQVVTTPEAQVSFVLNGVEVARGTSPLINELKPGKYQIRFENFKLGLKKEIEKEFDSGQSYELDEKLEGGASPASVAAGASFALSQQDFDRLTGVASEGGTGAANANYLLGRHFADKGDKDNAYKFYVPAAKCGHEGAEYELGVLFFTGGGITVKQDFDAAMYWLLKSAVAGHKGTTEFLAQRQFPNGFPKDFDNHIWIQQKLDSNRPLPGLREQREGVVMGLKDELQKKGLPN